MSIIVGIDLGTTNSCVAVPAGAPIPDRDRLVEQRRLRPVGDALVITDEYRSPTMPSVVWVGPDDAVLVGMKAKQRAETTAHPPAMYFKRNMGTNQRVRAGHAELTPMEASTHVLRALKELAEEVLGVPVERAVITVPAFFETRAKNETTMAGAAAGLEVVETLIEPVAAAMAYTHEHRAALGATENFLVYDLGGGTFDTSVVAWDAEVGFENRSFDGDRYLGGYDFDRHLVRWITDQLPWYDLAVSPDDPRDQQVHAALIGLAEHAKHDLSRGPFTDIVDQRSRDRSGVPMNINLEVTRSDFEGMIRPLLEGTITSCTRALAQAGVDASALSEIIMVGGSSRIPLAATLLEEHLGKTPKIVNPDLCVAVGAALKAALAPSRDGILELDRPTSDGKLADISGRVLAEGDAAHARATVVLRSDDGTIRLDQAPDEEGGFLFANVGLRPGEQNGFTITVIAGGREVAAEHLLLQGGGGGGSLAVDAPGDVLALGYALQLRSGLREVAPSGTRIPCEVEVSLQTVSQGMVLNVILVEGQVPIGSVTIEDVPADLPIGSEVKVRLLFQTGWTIEAEATIPSIGASAVAVISIPQREVLTWPELRRRHSEVQAAWAMRRLALPPDEAIRVGPVIDALFGELEYLLREAYDQAKTHHKLLEVTTLVENLTIDSPSNVEFEPPFAHFEETVNQIRREIRHLLRAGRTVEASSYREKLDDLESAGRAAHSAKDPVDWLGVNDRLKDLLGTLMRTAAPGPGPDNLEVPSPEELRDVLVSRLQALVVTVQREDRASNGAKTQSAAGLLTEIGDLARGAMAIDTERDPDALRKLAVLYTNGLEPLQAKVRNWATMSTNIDIDEKDENDE